MIGVLYKSYEELVAREFFELFKTPWEPYEPGHYYDVLLTTSSEIPDVTAKLIIIYGSGSTRSDSGLLPLQKGTSDECIWVQGDGFELPIYGSVSAVALSNRCFLRSKESGDCIGVDVGTRNRSIVRICYDLFQEAAVLLSKGQPACNAAIPTLELHISILRDCIRNAGVAFVELLPAPYGYDFSVSLTHDVDFVGIRDHKFDHTVLGFLYRATVGSLVSLARRRNTWTRCVENWKAAGTLPLVYLGLCEDFWIEFHRYAEIERDLNPTFFFIPFRDEPGTWNGQPAPSRRAAKYDVRQLKEVIDNLVEHGCEIGLHGLNAWRDSESGILERKRLDEVFEQSEVGVRMHWLYTDERSPKILEKAGFAYDSTYGYNEAIGFRAGTAQAFCPIGAPGLIELPLIIQDTAMFYPDRMNLLETEAIHRCIQVIESMIMHGGALTVNWHTRSLSPERLWGDFYKALLARIKQSRVWFCNAGASAKWFRARRAVHFQPVNNGEELRLRIDVPLEAELPDFRVRVYSNGQSDHLNTYKQDVAWRGCAELSICLASTTRV